MFMRLGGNLQGRLRHPRRTPTVPTNAKLSMGLRVKVSTRAASQVRRAAEWWAVNRPAAFGAIAADFGESVALLAKQPGIGATLATSATRTTGRSKQAARKRTAV